MNVAVPVTWPEGWLGSAEVSVREKVQGVFAVHSRALKRVDVCDDGGIGDGEGSEGTGLEFLIGIVIVSLFFPVEEGAALGSWLSSNTALTLCSVVRLGFRAGLLVVIQLKRCLMNALPISFAGRGALVSRAPASLTYRQRIASAVPTERSLPVGQQSRILPV